MTDTRPPIALVGAKHGTGTSTIALGVAATLAEREPVTLWDASTGDLAAIGGLAMDLDAGTGEALAGDLFLRRIPEHDNPDRWGASGDPARAVIDAGTIEHLHRDHLPAGTVVYLVTDLSYVTLRRATHRMAEPVDGIVTQTEPFRALDTRNVAAVLDSAPFVGWIERSRAIARNTDAGVLAARLPQNLRGLAHRIIEHAAAVDRRRDEATTQ